MLPMLKETKIIGEIGLDSVWCKTDEALQYSVFEQQLTFAPVSYTHLILTRYASTDSSIHEFKSFSLFLRLKFDPYMTIPVSYTHLHTM